MRNIKNPVKPTPSNGKRRIERIPSSERGRPARALRSKRTTPPARKPPTKAPRKPDDTAAGNSPLAAPKAIFPNADPELAIDPAINPATKPGFSAIENPM